MKLKNEFEPIRNWASEKGIYKNGDVKTQALKLMEEVGETAKAILNSDEEEIIDGLGDSVVVLVNLAKLAGYNLEDCVNSAYNVIKNRKGKMENGTFKKEIETIKTNPIFKLELHKNGYYNLPCQHHEIPRFMINNDVMINGSLYTKDSRLHLIAKPSKQIGGNAYIFKNKL